MPRRYTHEEFLEKFNEVDVNNEYELLSKYINSATKIKVLHKTCGNIWEVDPSNFLRGTRCPICMREQANNKTRKTPEQFVLDVKALWGDEMEVVDKDDYINSATKILIKHNKCGHEFMIKPRDLLQGNGCPKCAGRVPLTWEEVKAKIDKYGNGEYELVGGEETFENSNSIIEVLHKKCGNVFETRLCYFVTKGMRCPICAKKEVGLKKRKSLEKLKEELYEKYGDEYIIINADDYETTASKILVEHNVEGCHHQYSVIANNLLRGGKCPKCTHHIPLTWEDVERRFEEQTNEEYELIGGEDDFKGVSSRIIVRHNTCGTEWDVSVHNFLGRGTRCPKCMIRRGEETNFWKGGISPIGILCRNKTQHWLWDTAKIYKSHCIFTEKYIRNGLEVHHVFNTFADIRDKILRERNLQPKDFIYDLTEEQKEEIGHAILLEHYKSGYGVYISSRLHRIFHSIYGKENTTLEQFLEYAKKYHNLDLEVRESVDHIKYVARCDWPEDWSEQIGPNKYLPEDLKLN